MILKKLNTGILTASLAFVMTPSAHAYELTVNSDGTCTMSDLTSEDKLARYWGFIEFFTTQLISAHKRQNSPASIEYNQAFANVIEAARLGEINPETDLDAIKNYVAPARDKYVDSLNSVMTNTKQREYSETKRLVEGNFHVDFAIAISPLHNSTNSLLATWWNTPETVRSSIEYSNKAGQFGAPNRQVALAFGMRQCSKKKMNEPLSPSLASNLGVLGSANSRLNEKAESVFKNFLQQTGTSPNADDAVYAITGRHIRQPLPSVSQWQQNPIGALNQSVNAGSSLFGSS